MPFTLISGFALSDQDCLSLLLSSLARFLFCQTCTFVETIKKSFKPIFLSVDRYSASDVGIVFMTSKVTSHYPFKELLKRVGDRRHPCFTQMRFSAICLRCPSRDCTGGFSLQSFIDQVSIYVIFPHSYP